MDFANTLSRLMAGKPKPSDLGSGMAYQAGRTMGSDAEYQKYVADTQERGESPMSREDWLRSQGR